MKKSLSILACALLFLGANAQTGDSNKLPKHKFGLKEITIENKAEALKSINRIPELKISKSLRSKVSGKDKAITYIDNSTNKFFPPVVNQISNSCGCASNVHYIYSYELNFLLNRDGKKKENISEYMYIWNFLNEGLENGTFPWDVYDMIDANGAVSKDIYTTNSVTEWATGYDKYKAGMQYRIKSTSQMDPSTEEGFQAMKQYLIDHANGSAYGGLIQFSAWADPLDASYYRNGSDSGITAIIPLFGNDGMHSMTVVGFDDSTWWDYNKDGNRDADELGSFICINTWGTSWGDNGKFFAPYKTFTTLRQSPKGTYPADGGGIGNAGKECFVLTAELRDVKMALKLGLSHDSRNDLSINVGVSTDPKASKASFSRKFSPMSSTGGDQYMRGKSYNALYKDMEVGIDISDILDKAKGAEEAVFFVDIANKKVLNQGEGSIYSCSLIDYRTTPAKEYVGIIDNTILKNTSYSQIRISTKPLVGQDDFQAEDFMGFSAIAVKKCLTVVLDVKKESKLEIELLDDMGKRVKRICQETVKAGTFTKVWQSENIETGTYTLRVIANNQLMCKTIKFK